MAGAAGLCDVPGGLPQGLGGILALDGDDGDAACAAVGEATLGFVDQGSGDAFAASARGDRQPVEVAAPAVPCGDDAADDHGVVDGHEAGLGVGVVEGAEGVEVVGGRGLGVGVRPETEDLSEVVGFGRPDRDAHRVIVGAGATA